MNLWRHAKNLVVVNAVAFQLTTGSGMEVPEADDPRTTPSKHGFLSTIKMDLIGRTNSSNQLNVSVIIAHTKTYSGSLQISKTV